MAAIDHFAPAQASALACAVAALVSGVRAISRALKNRRDANRLAGMDDRMLADIGLTRSDLRDAYAQPMWRDPTDILAGRARDKRRYRRTGSTFHVSPSLAPETTAARASCSPRKTF